MTSALPEEHFDYVIIGSGSAGSAIAYRLAAAGQSRIAVIEFGGITAAGERLGRSQPAISIQIKKLEQQLGAELLQRQGQRLSLTPDGERVYDYAQRIISLHEQLLAQFQPQAVSGDIRLGITSEFASSLLPNVLGQFAQVYPQIALQVTSALSKDLFAGLGERFDMILALREQLALLEEPPLCLL